MTLPRSSGVLLHISSLWGSDSIGSFGREARDFIDFLADCGFTWWQVLPFCMADECNSPYKSYSAFGGNPYFVDIRILAADGYLTRDQEAISDKRRNMGIGLSVCKSIVQAHGGAMRACNRPAGGALLQFTLPLEETSHEDQRKSTSD